jgi:hypothetical protein
MSQSDSPLSLHLRRTTCWVSLRQFESWLARWIGIEKRASHYQSAPKPPISVVRNFNMNRVNILRIPRPGQVRASGMYPKGRELLN